MNYIIIYLEIEHLLNFLTQEEKGDFLDLLITYGKNQKLPEIENKKLLNVFNFMKGRLDTQFEKAKLKAETAKKNGATGGRPKKEAKKKQKRSKTEANANVNVNPNVNDNLNLESKSKSLNFETFWNFYTPVAGRDGKSIDKGSKADAKKSYEKAIALNFSHETIMKALEFYLRECQKNARFTKHAVSWLNQAIRDEFKFEQTTVILPEAVPQKLTKDQQQDLINKQLEEEYANN